MRKILEQAQSLMNRLPKAARFLVVGGFCALANVLMIVFFTNVYHFHYLISFTLMFIITTILGFILNKKYTYKCTSPNFWAQLYKYFSVTFSGYLFSLAAIFVLVDLLRFNFVVSYILMAVMITIYNFFAHDLWSFRTKAASTSIE